jgi:hypothetical protein
MELALAQGQRMKRITPILLAALMICGMERFAHAQGIASAEPQRQVSPEVRFVAAGIEDSRQKLHNAQATVSYYQFTPKESFDRWRKLPYIPSNLPSKDLETRQLVHWYLQDPYLVMQIQPDRNEPNNNILSERFITDSNTVKVLDEYLAHDRPDFGIYHIGIIRRPEGVVKNGLWQYRQELDPRQNAYYSAVTPLDRVLLKSDPPAEFKREEAIEGSKCMKIEASPMKGFRATYWFDVEHGFILRKAELFVVVAGNSTLIRETTIPHLLESNDMWLPALVEIKDFAQSQPTNQDATSQKAPTTLANLKRITISDFKTNVKGPPETRVMRWPLGTNITDDINQRRLIVVALEKHDLAMLNEQRKAHDKFEYASTPIEEKELSALNQRLKEQGRPALKEAAAVAVESEDLAIVEKLQAQQSTRKEGEKP